MGLDMYLNARRFLWSYPEGGPEDIKRKQVAELLGDTEMNVKYITVEAAYWRKCNSVHNWFVNNVQDGRDECQTSAVSCDQLEELLDLVNQVLADHSLANELLPTQSGFFFGGTEYDDWYFGDLARTKTMLEDCLSDRYKGWDFEYSASW